MSRHPEVKWAQRLDKVFITIQLPDSRDTNVDLGPDGVLKFSATAGTGNNLYELNLELFDKVNVDESKINKGVRSIFCIIEKADKEWWKKLLRGEGKTPHYIKVDWDKWADEDDDAGTGDLDTGGMDFSKFGGAGDMGMGGMDFSKLGGAGGMGMEGMDFSKLGGAGGMGMEGMDFSKLAGMGGMGNDLEDSDDDDEGIEENTAEPAGSNNEDVSKTGEAPTKAKV